MTGFGHEQTGCVLLRRQAVPALLKRLLLEHGPVRVECTPRRLAVLVPDLAPRQPDVEEDIRGPPAKVEASLHLIANHREGTEHLWTLETQRESDAAVLN
jgi:hypothetical protein